MCMLAVHATVHRRSGAQRAELMLFARLRGGEFSRNPTKYLLAQTRANTIHHSPFLRCNNARACGNVSVARQRARANIILRFSRSLWCAVYNLARSGDYQQTYTRRMNITRSITMVKNPQCEGEASSIIGLSVDRFDSNVQIWTVVLCYDDFSISNEVEAYRMTRFRVVWFVSACCFSSLLACEGAT